MVDGGDQTAASDATGLGATGVAPELRADRVLLRGWRADDLAPFAELNADPRVMEHFQAPLTRAQSDAFVRERTVPEFAERGFGLWQSRSPVSHLSSATSACRRPPSRLASRRASKSVGV